MEGGTDLNTQSYDGKTPLMVACCAHYDNHDEDRIAIVKQLLKHKADTNIQDVRGRTALMYALRYTVSPEIVKLLLDNGANQQLVDMKGKDAFSYIRPRSLSHYIEFFRPNLKMIDYNMNSVTENKNVDHNNTNNDKICILPNTFQGRLRVNSSEMTDRRNALHKRMSERSDSEEMSSVDYSFGRSRRHSHVIVPLNDTWHCSNRSRRSSESSQGASSYLSTSDSGIDQGQNYNETDTDLLYDINECPMIRSNSLHTPQKSKVKGFRVSRRMSCPESSQRKSNQNSVSNIDKAVLAYQIVPKLPKLPPIGKYSD